MAHNSYSQPHQPPHGDQYQRNMQHFGPRDHSQRPDLSRTTGGYRHATPGQQMFPTNQRHSQPFSSARPPDAGNFHHSKTSAHPSNNTGNPSQMNIGNQPRFNAFIPPPPNDINIRNPPPMNTGNPSPMNVGNTPTMNQGIHPPMNNLHPPPFNTGNPPPINTVNPPPINTANPPPNNTGNLTPMNTTNPPPTNMGNSPFFNYGNAPPMNMGFNVSNPPIANNSHSAPGHVRNNGSLINPRFPPPMNMPNPPMATHNPPPGNLPPFNFSHTSPRPYYDGNSQGFHPSRNAPSHAQGQLHSNNLNTGQFMPPPSTSTSTSSYYTGPFPPNKPSAAMANSSFPFNNQNTEPKSSRDIGSEILQGWLKKSEESKKAQRKQMSSNKEGHSLKLWESVQDIVQLKKILSNMKDHISSMEKTDLFTTDTKTWDEASLKLESDKERLKKFTRCLETSCVLERKELFEKAKKKRLKRQNSKRRKFELSQIRKEENELKSSLIDKWQEKFMKKMKDENMKEKRKAAADKTLSKVTKEIQDANRLIETMNALQKLRLIRRDAAEKRGDSDIGESRETFEEKITDMIRLVRGQLEHYKDEETRLKSIIKSEVEESDRKLEAIKKETEQLKENAEDYELRTMLFGPDDEVKETDPLFPFTQFYRQAENSLPAFLQIRQEWDSFLVPENLAGGSQIPNGWVMPEEPSTSSEAWSKCLM